MKKYLFVVFFLFVFCLVLQAQEGAVAPVVNVYGTAVTISDSLLAMVHAKDSSATPGLPRMYVTPSMVNNSVWPTFHTSSEILAGSVSGGITITPIATGTAVTTIQNQNVAAAVITLPSATTTLPGLGLNNVFTGTAQWNGATSGGVKIAPIATGTAVATIQNQNVAASVITLPSATSTLPGLELTNSWTSNNTVTYSKTAAADVGTVRAVYGKYALTGATPVTAASDNMVGTRGEFNIATGGVLDFYAGSSFATGVQGKIVASGTSTWGSTVGHQDLRAQAVHGQLDLTGVTLNGGQVSIAEFDVQVRPAAINGVNQFNLLKITDASSSKTTEAASIFYAYAHAQLFMDLVTPEGAAADWVGAGGTGYTYTLKVNFNGVTKYLRLYDSP